MFSLKLTSFQNDRVCIHDASVTVLRIRFAAVKKIKHPHVKSSFNNFSIAVPKYDCITLVYSPWLSVVVSITIFFR